MTKLTWSVTVMAVLSSVLASPIYVAAEVSEKMAIESAHTAIATFGVTPSQWTFYVEKDHRTLQDYKTRWQERSLKEKQLGREDTDFGPWLARMESVTEGKRVWTVIYKLKLSPGQRALHPNAMVFIDADSGKVLALIEPEGSPQFPQ